MPALDRLAIAVVIPCYKVTRHILSVIDAIGPIVATIICVDDACPDGSGAFIKEHCRDPRVRIIRHQVNKGVGGAVLSGYDAAIAAGADIIVKIDGDGQMDPSLIAGFIQPIVRGEADYTKGNRFWDLMHIHKMPLARRIGNLGLSFLAKASTGYWNLFDPTNGYTAIHTNIAQLILKSKVSERYFFETDVLFRLGTMGAVVVDVPMDAKYDDEVSNLSITSALLEFSQKHLRNFCKRILYQYFLRDVSVASIELVSGLGLILFSFAYGGLGWLQSNVTQQPAATGTIMVAALSFIAGFQLLLAFMNYDISRRPLRPLHPALAGTLS